MSWVTIKFSPEAKHAWKWFHTWLVVIAGGAPFVYENIDAINGALPPSALKWLNLILMALMAYNAMRSKKK